MARMRIQPVFPTGANMTRIRALIFFLTCSPVIATADLTGLIPEHTIGLIAEESSGVSAKRNLDTITLYHRTRASSQFRQAAEHIL